MIKQKINVFVSLKHSQLNKSMFRVITQLLFALNLLTYSFMYHEIYFIY